MGEDLKRRGFHPRRKDRKEDWPLGPEGLSSAAQAVFTGTADSGAPEGVFLQSLLTKRIFKQIRESPSWVRNLEKKHSSSRSTGGLLREANQTICIPHTSPR